MAAVKKKCVLVGGGESGKSCMHEAHIENRFPKPYSLSVGDDCYDCYVNVDGTRVLLTVWDTAGQEDYAKFRTLAYPHSDVVLLCFALDQPSSLDTITDYWLPEVRQNCPRAPILLVGCKKDLKNDPVTLRKFADFRRTPFKPEELRALAKKIDAFDYLECSAKTKEGLSEVFETAARAALYGPRVRKKKSSCSFV
ncbi:unnamed protein product [Nesidiocoris tenuis]|uniref:Ras homolog gene family, member A n=2 Tax=Nesidiocoris tenuis TaxID=355587 RepID=A0ABN7AN28_9HEMI|nr:Ras homolog gene family, member A [Nesidiocoris tenuis]CAB0014642.1 unnamed protein product [Nesidiocoris tenuis]